jgi:hypothetical protein
MSPIPVFGVESSIPRECAGFSFSEATYYDDPKLGISIRYYGPSLIYANTYLYNLGRSYITDDLESPEVMQWFQEACHGILRYAELGSYLNLEEVNSKFLYLPQDDSDPFCLWASFIYNPAPGPGISYTGQLMSHIALRTDRGFINKVRFSYPYTEEISEVGRKGFLHFLLEWTHAVQNF